MGKREYGYTFDSESIFAHIQRDATSPPVSKLDDDFYLFVMGPYTAFDATYVYDNADKLKSPFIEDPLFDPQQHVTEDGRGDFEAALDDYCSKLRKELGVHAFLASDIGIKTEEKAADGEPSMSVLDQSIAFAAVSDAVMFILTPAGLTSGAEVEVGALLGEFHLRKENPEPVRKPRPRFRIFKTENFSSASIREIPSTYGVGTMEFADENELFTNTQHFLADIERDDPDRPLPIFNPY